MMQKLCMCLIPEHDHGLLADVVGVLGDDEVDILVVYVQGLGELDPVRAEQVGDVGDPEVGAVDGVELAVSRLAEEAVLGLDGHQVLVGDAARLGADLLRQPDVEVTHRRLLHLASSLHTKQRIKISNLLAYILKAAGIPI